MEQRTGRKAVLSRSGSIGSLYRGIEYYELIPGIGSYFLDEMKEQSKFLIDGFSDGGGISD